MGERGIGPKPCLEGVRVIDFSMLTPGAFASQILADLGATVLKIERPGTGDLERITVPAYFRAYNRGKGSAVIDLATSAGHAEAMGLVAAADVLIDGFRPGVMDRLGLGFDQVREVRDTIVHCSINGLGSEGPFAQDRGHDSDFMARCGALDPANRAGGIPAYDNPMPVSDYAAAMYAAIAIVGELGRPERSAVRLEVPIMAAGLAWMFPKILRDIDERRDGVNAVAEKPGIGCFRCADGAWVTITAAENHVFAALAEAIGAPQLGSDPANATYTGRKVNAAAINRLLGSWIEARERPVVEARMRELGVCCAPVNSTLDALDDPQVRALGIVHRDPEHHADLPVFGIPKVRHVRAPELGEDSAHVSANGWTGLSDRLSGR
jgi:crotonobetainyl-CoA:carnitine CoA-transferase CaiB-like acyl-CoA transferase